MPPSNYRWTPRISPAKMRRLYASDASGLHDAALVEDVGFTIYVRCREGKEVMVAVHENRILCRGCLRAYLSRRSSDPADAIACDCGWATTWGDYRQSTFAQNMCNGAAQPLFDDYAVRWERAEGYAAKMRLIDWLIHQFHVQNQIPGRAVGVNIVAGTNQQVADLIADLAYGEGSAAALEERAAYLARTTDWRKVLRDKLGGNTATRKVGIALGIVGSSTMPMDALIDEISQVDAPLVEKALAQLPRGRGVE